MDNLDIWQKVSRPPKDALRQIEAGRLRGKTDISPQWRLKVMTELFGPCGSGWGYQIERLWTEPGQGGEVMAFALVTVWYSRPDHQRCEVPGIGGAALIVNEKNGPHSNDEAFKMAVTDALSVAMKALGVAADIYAGLWDGTKYKDGGPSASLEPPRKLSERLAPASSPAAAAPTADSQTPARESLTLTGELSLEERFGRLLSAAERRSLQGIITKTGVSTQAVRDFCQETWGFTSSTEVRVGMVPTLNEWLQGKAA
jgi:hypothetical protein